MIAILSQDKRYLCMYGVEEATMVRCESKFVYIRTGSKDKMERLGTLYQHGVKKMVFAWVKKQLKKKAIRSQQSLISCQ